jgi:hypothetical protein
MPTAEPSGAFLIGGVLRPQKLTHDGFVDSSGKLFRLFRRFESFGRYVTLSATNRLPV